MRQLNGVYTQQVNRTYGRVGHVFQGRFKAVLVDEEGYLLELARYVVLSPVRASMVADAKDWPWSSYGATAGHVVPPTWLAADALLAQFAATRSRARQKYIDHVRAGVGLPSVWDGLVSQVFLGGEAFLARMQKLAAQQDHALEIPKAQRRPKAKSLASYERVLPDRNAAMAAAYASGDYTLAAIAAHFKVHYATVSRAVAGLARKAN